MTDLRTKAGRLRALHHGPMLVLPNAWDAASARAFEQAGFPAVATTSAGVAAALGYPDGEQAPVDEMFAAAARIARAVDVPVSADLEAGYGLAPDELAARIAEAGVVGCNLEDTDHASGGRGLVDAGAHAERLAAVTAAAGDALVLNARVDTFVRGDGDLDERLEEAVARGRRYAAAGAESVYPILAADERALATMVEAVPAAINVYLRPEAPSLRRLRELGVQRVTFGSSLFRDALAGVEAAAVALHATAEG